MNNLNELEIYILIYIWLKELQNTNNIYDFKIKRKNYYDYDVAIYPVIPIKTIKLDLKISI